jgi:hypothetical protein
MAKQKRRPAVTKSRRGKPKTVAKKQARATASKVAKKSAAKNRTKALTSRVTLNRASQKARPRKKKHISGPAPQAEAAIVDIVEQPGPGIVTVTEIESVRVTVPDSAEETNTEHLPPEEGGMAA